MLLASGGQLFAQRWVAGSRPSLGSVLVDFSDVGEDRAVERSSRLHFILLGVFVDVSISC